MDFSNGRWRTRMPKPYPDPKINQSIDVLKYANTVTDGWMVKLLVLAIGIVIFALIKNRYFKISQPIAISLFLTTLLTTFLWLLGFIEQQFLVGLFVVFIASMLWSVFDN